MKVGPGGCLAAAGLAALALAGCRGPAREEPPAPSEAAAPAAPEARGAGRLPVRADRAWLAGARAVMGDAANASCGPYLLVTDVRNEGPRDLCSRIGSRLETVYRRRFGLDPVGDPEGAVLVFERRQDFRSWAADTAGLRAGYAGFSRAARGIVALPADEQLFASTLAHELTHLVNRRALGSDLPPWLSEGLADAIGDAAGAAGLEELVGIRGAEGQARRLAVAYRSQQPPRLASLAARRRDEFDRSVPSYDYEQSALAVRMLLLEKDLAPGFRRFLESLAAGEEYAPELLPRALGVGWEDLDQRLAVWVEDQLSPGSPAL